MAFRASYPAFQKLDAGATMPRVFWSVLVSIVPAALCGLLIGALTALLIGYPELRVPAAVAALAFVGLLVLFVRGASGPREALNRSLGTTMAVTCWCPLVLLVGIFASAHRSGSGVDSSEALGFYYSLWISGLIAAPCLVLYLVLHVPRFWAWLHEP